MIRFKPDPENQSHLTEPFSKSWDDKSFIDCVFSANWIFQYFEWWHYSTKIRRLNFSSSAPGALLDENIRTLNFSSIAPQGQYSKKIKINFFSSCALENDVIQGALLEKGATRRAVLEGHYSMYNAPTKSSVSGLSTISMCTHRTVKHVNNTIHLLSRFLPCLM